MPDNADQLDLPRARWARHIGEDASVLEGLKRLATIETSLFVRLTREIATNDTIEADSSSAIATEAGIVPDDLRRAFFALSSFLENLPETLSPQAGIQCLQHEGILEAGLAAALIDRVAAAANSHGCDANRSADDEGREDCATRVSHRPIWEVAVEIGKSVPDEEWAKVPRDLARNYKHYLYGAPKEVE